MTIESAELEHYRAALWTARPEVQGGRWVAHLKPLIDVGGDVNSPVQMWLSRRERFGPDDHTIFWQCGDANPWLEREHHDVAWDAWGCSSAEVVERQREWLRGALLALATQIPTASAMPLEQWYAINEWSQRNYQRLVFMAALVGRRRERGLRDDAFEKQFSEFTSTHPDDR